MPSRSVVIVEDDPMTRGILAELLEAAGFRVATASNGSDARRLCSMLDPDAVIMDIDLGVGPTGFDVAEALLVESPHLNFLFLTNLPDPRFAGHNSNSVPTGSAYLRKERLAQPGLLVETLDTVLRGQVSRRERDDLKDDRPFQTLTTNQLEVLRMVALGLSNQQIAERRGTSVRAVQIMMVRIFEALELADDSDASARVSAARNYISKAGLPLADS
uniref:Transcriptional regulatory protein LiaR n=1 Tax=uncultured Actinomycetes bacterium TaxID=152507 RepID=A0A871Y6W4_9ACTN|nr:Transcriptional regulatory protein LiaR [uncultured Actinomycetes bacterium]